MSNRFAIVDLSLLQQLSPLEAIIYSYIANTTRHGMVYDMRADDAASMFGTSTITYKRAIKTLSDGGWIIVERKQYSHKITCPQMYQNDTSEPSQMYQNDTSEPSQMYQNDTSHIIYNYYKESDNAHTRVRARENGEEYLDGSTPSLESECYGVLLREWAEFYKSINGREYFPDFKTIYDEGMMLVDTLMRYLDSKNKERTKENFELCISQFLPLAYQVADDWQTEHFDLRTLNSQFNKFLKQIQDAKTGRRQKKAKRTTSDEYDRRIRADLERAIQDLAAQSFGD